MTTRVLVLRGGERILAEQVAGGSIPLVCIANDGPIPVSIVGASVTLNVDDTSIDIPDRVGRMLGHVAVDSLPPGLARDATLASVVARLGDGSTHVVVDAMPEAKRRWECQIIAAKEHETLAKMSSELGGDGWEIVSCLLSPEGYLLAALKRRV